MNRYSAVILCCLLPTALFAGKTADRVFGGINEYRAKQQMAPAVRSPLLDRVAHQRAERIAGLPDRQRLNIKEGLSSGIRAAGMRLFGEMRSRVDLSRGYRDPASSIVAKWLESPGWGDAMDSRFDLAGVADVTAADGTLVFVALLIESPAVPDDVDLMVSLTHAAINKIRHEHGLRPLQEDAELRAVAMDHSDDMAARGFFDHRNPDGKRPADRVLAAKLPYRAIAENIQMSQSVRNPVQTAVDAWMDSKGHRENILDDRYTHSGIGIQIRDDGSVYFTQLFWLPAPGLRPVDGQ